MHNILVILALTATTTSSAKVDSYGYKFRRIAGTQDCRLQLNLPGYPPAFQSSLESTRTQTGSQNSKDGSYGTDRYGKDRYGSSSSDYSSSILNKDQGDDMRDYRQKNVECKGGEYYSTRRRKCTMSQNAGSGDYNRWGDDRYQASSSTGGVSSSSSLGYQDNGFDKMPSRGQSSSNIGYQNTNYNSQDYNKGSNMGATPLRGQSSSSSLAYQDKDYDKPTSVGATSSRGQSSSSSSGGYQNKDYNSPADYYQPEMSGNVGQVSKNQGYGNEDKAIASGDRYGSSSSSNYGTDSKRGSSSTYGTEMDSQEKYGSNRGSSSSKYGTDSREYSSNNRGSSSYGTDSQETYGTQPKVAYGGGTSGEYGTGTTGFNKNKGSSSSYGTDSAETYGTRGTSSSYGTDSEERYSNNRGSSNYGTDVKDSNKGASGTYDTDSGATYGTGGSSSYGTDSQESYGNKRGSSSSYGTETDSSERYGNNRGSSYGSGSNRESSYYNSGNNRGSSNYDTDSTRGSSSNYGTNSQESYGTNREVSSFSNSKEIGTKYTNTDTSFGTDSVEKQPDSSEGSSYGTKRRKTFHTSSGTSGTRYGHNYDSTLFNRPSDSDHSGHHHSHSHEEFGKGHSGSSGHSSDRDHDHHHTHSHEHSNTKFDNKDFSSSSGYDSASTGQSTGSKNTLGMSSSGGGWTAPSKNTGYSDKENLPSENGYDKEFVEEALQAHNGYRAKHGATPLALDQELTTQAQMLADSFASGNPFGHSKEAKLGKVGENIAVRSGPTVGSTAVDFWYKEMSNYDFDSPKLVVSPSGKSNVHFSAILWNSTRKVGIGKAKSKDGRTFVVAQYFPAGNFPNKATENVFPLLTRASGARLLTDPTYL